MRSAALTLLLIFACKPVPLDLGDDPDDDGTDVTTDAPSGPTGSSDGGSDTGSLTSAGSGIMDTGSDPLVPNHCDPSIDTCGAGEVCCSNDPATVGGKLPNYFEPGVNDEMYGTPIFSGDNNELGNYGECIEVGGFPTPFASGCPVPCNPTWTAKRRSIICGVGATCCQRHEVDPDKDCVLDPMTERWRAVTGHDIGTPLTNWGDQHATNQDPIGKGCDSFAADGEGEPDLDVLADCYAQLSVADQRGYCQAKGTCPCYEDLCDMKNPDWVPRCP